MVGGVARARIPPYDGGRGGEEAGFLPTTVAEGVKAGIPPPTTVAEEGKEVGPRSLRVQWLQRCIRRIPPR